MEKVPLDELDAPLQVDDDRLLDVSEALDQLARPRRRTLAHTSGPVDKASSCFYPLLTMGVGAN